MIIKHEIDVRSGLLSRMIASYEALREDWLEEAEDARDAGNFKRVFYLEHLSTYPGNLIDRSIMKGREDEARSNLERLQRKYGLV